jgi:hypothetical protein
MSALCRLTDVSVKVSCSRSVGQKRTLLPLDVWQLVSSIKDRLRSTNQNIIP